MDFKILVDVVSGDPDVVYEGLSTTGVVFDSVASQVYYDMVVIIDEELKDPGALDLYKKLLRVTHPETEFLYIHPSGSGLKEQGSRFYSLGVSPYNFSGCVVTRVSEFIHESRVTRDGDMLKNK